jgi:hypothetical protein
MARNRRDDRAIDLIPIADQLILGIIPREGLRDLTRNPLRWWVCCDVDPDQVSAVEPDDDEGREQVEPIVGTTNKSIAAISGA